MLSSYSELATEFYNIDKPIGCSLGGDIEFYQERLHLCKGRILEPAVGTGRLLIPLLEAGLTVDGFDNSPQMLEVCRNECKERGLTPTLYEAEMQNFSSSEKYEAVILPAGSFQLLERHEDALKALKVFHSHLPQNGKLIVDMFLQTNFDKNSHSTRTLETPDGNTITLEEQVVEVDFLHQYTITYLKYEKWHQGKLLKTELQRLPLHWYGINEFTLILEKSGFSDISVSANYELGKQPSNADQMFSFEAKRK